MKKSDERPWHTLGSVSPKSLSDTRLQLHWAAQAVAALANAILEKRSDDSQDTLGWRDALGAMMTYPLAKGLAAGLRLGTAELLLADENRRLWHFPINGSSLGELRAALREEAQRLGLDVEDPLPLRDYEMPIHAVQKGTAFDADLDGATELAGWFANADGALRRAVEGEAHVTDLRCWPHHFDLGLLLLLDPEEDSESARSIGMGLSPGDGSYSEPYFYVSPYPTPDPKDLPQLEAPGHWHTEGFLSRVLTATELLEATVFPEADGDQGEIVDRFLATAIAASRSLL